MNEVWAGVIGALVASGVVILHAEWQTWRTKSNQDKAVRRMLWVEIERNLEMARDLKRYINGQDLQPLSAETPFYAHEWGKVIVSVPPPSFSQDVWKAELEKVADAVGLDRAHLVMRHYGHVSVLLEQYEVLTLLRAKLPGVNSMVGATNTVHSFLNDLDSLIALGNPTRP